MVKEYNWKPREHRVFCSCFFNNFSPNRSVPRQGTLFSAKRQKGRGLLTQAVYPCLDSSSPRGCSTHSGTLCYLLWKYFGTVCGVFFFFSLLFCFPFLPSDVCKGRKPRGLEQISTERNTILRDPWNYMY